MEHHEVLATPGVHELFSLINLLVLLLIVVFFGRTAILQMFKTRSQKLRDELVVAREELGRITTEIQTARMGLDQIEQEKAQLLKNVEAEARALGDKLVADAQASAARIMEDSSRAVEAEFAESKNRLREEILTSVTTKVKEEFAQESSRQRLHEKLIESFLGVQL